MNQRNVKQRGHDRFPGLSAAAVRAEAKAALFDRVGLGGYAPPDPPPAPTFVTFSEAMREMEEAHRRQMASMQTAVYRVIAQLSGLSGPRFVMPEWVDREAPWS